MNKEDKRAFIARVETLLKEQLEELGENPSLIKPHEYARQMRCEVYPDKSMIYFWKGMPVLRLVPEYRSEGKVFWHFFTSEDRTDTFQ